MIATGLFSFLLAHNDFAVTAMILSKESPTVNPKIASFLGTIQTKGNVVFAVVSVPRSQAFLAPSRPRATWCSPWCRSLRPLFMLIMFFQRHIFSGLTVGAVKG